MNKLVAFFVEKHTRWSTRKERQHLVEIEKAMDTGEIPRFVITEVAERGISDNTWERLYKSVFASRWIVPKTAIRKARKLTNLKALPTVQPFLTPKEVVELLRKNKNVNVVLDFVNDTVEWRLARTE